MQHKDALYWDILSSLMLHIEPIEAEKLTWELLTLMDEHAEGRYGMNAE